MKLRITAAAFLCFGLWCETNAQPNADPNVAKVDAVFAQWNKPGSPGCVCSVYRNGKTILAKGYGMADLEHDVPITPESVFYVGSTTKQFTAASIALLVLDGKLSLATDIHTLFPEFRGLGAPVTVEQLVHHTSGVRDYYALLALQGWTDADRLNNEMIVALLAKQKSLNFPPGSQFLYSNSNYVLLAEIVKRVSGTPLPQFARERLFAPLQMQATQFESDATQIVRHRVISYDKKGATFRQYHKTTDAYGAGNLLTTVGDLARWDENFYTGQVGGKPLLDEFQVQGVLSNSAGTDYGFGLMYGKYRGLPIVSHGGAYQGFRAQLIRFPQQHFSVATLCNLGSIDPDALVRKVADIYLENALEPLKTAGAMSTPVEATIESTVFDAYLGNFAFDFNPRLVVSFTREGDNYFAQATGQPRAQIYPSSETEFFYRVANAGYTFHRDSAGAVNRITLHQGGNRDAQRVQSFTPTAEDLNQYAGKYFSDELDVTLELAATSSGLVIRGSRLPVVPLRPITRDRFAAIGAVAAFQRDAQGKVEGLSYGGGRALNMVFSKQP